MTLLFTILGGIFSTVLNATLFCGTSLGFSMLRNDGGKERKRHDLAEEERQRARDNGMKIELNDLISLTKDYVNEGYIRARVYINNVDEALVGDYRIFWKKLKPLPPEPQLSDFYHPTEEQKNGELLFVAVGTGIATYALYKYLK